MADEGRPLPTEPLPTQPLPTQPLPASPLPKVTPWLLRRADDLCARRLAREFEGADASYDPVNRGRIRDAFLAAARDVHAELCDPTERDFAGAGRDLEPEEQAVLRQAAHWYVHAFGGRAARADDHGLDRPTESRGRGLRVGGWVDLAVVDEDGARELRHLDLWAGPRPVADPLELPAVRLATLRLTRWAAGEPLRVVWADLVRGGTVERVVGEDDRAALARWFDERVAVVRDRAADPVAVMGADCQTCGHVGGCPEVPGAIRLGRGPNPLLPGWVTLTPTRRETWRRCRREWRDAHVLAVPPSDLDPAGVHGQQVHDLLRLVHEQGTCQDPGHVDDVLTAHGLDGDGRIRAELDRHARRCPLGAVALGHEITRVRAHRRPYPPFLASARLDALWVHDGILDAHDYKTGRVWSERVADDAQARLQAWVLAPLAAREGLRLRITFEHLASEVAEDPDPFEPDADDLDAIEEEMRADVAAMWSEADFHGVADPEVCGRCRYRSVCPDSAAPGEAVWPRVELDVDDPGR